MDVYYDQVTEMMVQWRQESLQTSGPLQTNCTQVMKMISSNVWTIPEFSPFNVVTAFIIGGVVSAVIFGVAKFKRASV